MNRILLINIGLFLLSGITHPLLSQEIKVASNKAEENPDQSSSSHTEAVLPEESLTDSLSETGTRSCITTFTNQTISTTMSVWGCTDLTAKTVTVKNGGNLSLLAAGKITMDGVFEVQLGGILKVSIEEPHQTIVNYDYDASGNRIARRFILTQ